MANLTSSLGDWGYFDIEDFTRVIYKIISGAQTGVDRGALDAAMDLHMQYGGWCPKGRKAEDGKIPARYAYLMETRSFQYPNRTEKNIRDSDATLIVCWGTPTGGTALTIRLCEKLKKPYCVADMMGTPLAKVVSWLGTYKPRTLNVAGPRASKHPTIDIQGRARVFVKEVLFMQPH